MTGEPNGVQYRRTAAAVPSRSRTRRIAVIQFYYYPDISAVSQMLQDLLGSLSWTGEYRFTVYCGRSFYTRDKALRHRRKSTRGGVRVRRLFTFGFGRRTLATRILDYSLYYVAVFFLCLFNVRWDAVVCLTSPPMIGVPVAVALAIRRTPFLHYVQDLYPELLADNGVIRRPWVMRRLRALSRMTYAKADRVIAISGPMAERLSGGYRVPARRITQIRNWAEGIDRREPRDGGEFTIMYSGNAGLGHGFDNLEPMLRELRHSRGLRYVFIGGGRSRPAVCGLFRRCGEERVDFHPYVPRERLGEELSGADLFIVAQKASNVGALLPSKVYAYLAAGRPILYLGPRRSEIGELIAREDLGLVVEGPWDARRAAAWVNRLMERGPSWHAMGRRARELFESDYRLSPAAASFERVLSELVGAC